MATNELKEFKIEHQKKDNSCWQCIANCILKYYMCKKSEHISLDTEIDKQGSAIDALMEKINLVGVPVIDQYALPTMIEIEKEIDKGNLLLCCMGVSPPPRKDKKNNRHLANESYQSGHWVAIVGYEIDKENGEEKILIADPQYDELKWVLYDEKYDGLQYFQNSSYIVFA